MYPEVLHDEFGCVVVTVRAEQLRDFPKLISWIRDQGLFSNILKVRLHKEDRRDEQVLDETLHALRNTLKKTIHSKKGKTFLYSPIAQHFFKASKNDHVYEFMNVKCTKQERKQFVDMATSKSSYLHESNCCTDLLKNGVKEEIKQHLFESIGKIAPLNDTVRQNEKKWQEVIQNASSTNNLSSFVGESMPIVYGAGIQLDPETVICLCDNFSLSKLNTVIDKLDEKYDGIAFPYLYCGVKHSSFPWHIEDGGLFSINYLFAGSPKVWFGIPPSDFGRVDRLASGLHIQKAHSSCRALLVDHKALLVDPEYFAKSCGVPYTTIIQEVGDFIITPPFGLHCGFNTGNNAAFAANFGDVPWIELGMYAPVCVCRDDQVHLNLTPILKEWRPDLLEKYLQGTSLTFPPGHPCDISVSSDVSQQEVKPRVTSSSGRHHENVTGCESNYAKRSLKKRVLFCPKCPSKSFAENKMKRLISHINSKHMTEKEKLVQIVESKYPKWKPKTQEGFKCQICGSLFRGSVTHVLQHHQKKHPGKTFKRVPTNK